MNYILAWHDKDTGMHLKKQTDKKGMIVSYITLQAN